MQWMIVLLLFDIEKVYDKLYNWSKSDFDNLGPHQKIYAFYLK